VIHMDKTIAFGIIAFAALLIAGCVSQETGAATATPQPSILPAGTATPVPASGATEAQVDSAISDVDKALAEMDAATQELSELNSQDINESTVGATG